MSKRTINPAAAEAELVKAKQVLRPRKRGPRGDKRERANMERSIETLAAGVEAVEKLRDAGEELEVKRERQAE